MEKTFNKLKEVILLNGNSDFRKVDKSKLIKMKLETKNSMLLIEEDKNSTIITMSLFEMYEGKFFAFRFEKINNDYVIYGESENSENEIIESKKAIDIFEYEVGNLV